MSKPTFNVLNCGHRKKVKPRWRKPRGTHNKKRMKMEWAGASPGIGYGSPEASKGRHPNGTKEVLVRNLADLEKLDGVSVRISAAVGIRKKKAIVEAAKAKKLKVLNSGEKKIRPRKKGGEKS
ncbi:50S ribosomal protein L32e [Candidatus Micrarchaeota archaeon]|nr:50S ribosomal protein L32e [Candidatus Micrarchaeota archaeon]